MNFFRRTAALMLTMILFISYFAVSASAAGNVMYGIGFVNTDNLRLRSDANTSSSVLDKAFKNDCVVVISQNGDWYKVNYNLQEGYMHKNYLNVLTKENAELGYGKVNGSGVNIRSGAGTSYRSVAVASKDSKCYILGLNDGWYKVIYNNTIGYIRSDFVDLTEIPYENRDSAKSPKFYRGGKSTGVTPSAAALNGTTGNTSGATTSTPANVTGAQILAEAQKYLGTPYVSGGASPSGFDCSGFVKYIFGLYGITTNRTAEDQAQNGYAVDRSQLQPGDIICFSYGSGYIGHVGIYIGNGQFVHACNSDTGVIITDLNSSSYTNRVAACRRLV